MTTPRLPMLSEAEALERGRALGIDDYIAQMHLFRVLLNHPNVAKALNDLIVSLVDEGSWLGPRWRELIIMRVSWLSGSVYEWSQHWMAALFLGLTEEELVAVRDWHGAACFDAADRAVLAAVDDTLNDGAISDATWRQLEERLDSVEQRLEVPVCIGNWHMFARIIDSLAIPLEDGLEPWPPDGTAPRMNQR